MKNHRAMVPNSTAETDLQATYRVFTNAVAPKLREFWQKQVCPHDDVDNSGRVESFKTESLAPSEHFGKSAGNSAGCGGLTKFSAPHGEYSKKSRIDNP